MDPKAGRANPKNATSAGCSTAKIYGNEMELKGIGYG
jgi:hypothetical protein